MAGIVTSALLTRLGKGAAATGSVERILKPFAEELFNQMGSLKFISYVGADGFPVLVPVVQCQAADSRRLAFAPLAFGKELHRIETGTEVAVFCLTMGMEDVLIRGTFRGFKRHRMISLGTVDIEWVYNSMPPAHGQIYPQVPLEPVTEF